MRDEGQAEKVRVLAGAGSASSQIRSLDPPEQQVLVGLLREFGVDPDSDWSRGRQSRIVAREDLEPQRRIVLVQQGVLGVVAPLEPHTVGLPVAHLARKGARLTLEGACWLAPHAKRRLVVVTPKGETLFLYGRELLLGSVKKVVGPVEPGQDVLVLRADGRCIGIGLAQAALLTKGRGASDAVAVTNRLDLGRYLRDAQEVLE